MSSMMIGIFIVILILLLVSNIAFSVLYLVLDFDAFVVIFYNVALAWLLLYFIGCAFAVYEFVVNLSDLTKAQSPTMDFTVEQTSIRLDEAQQTVCSILLSL